MKLVKAIIRPEKLTDVLKELFTADVQGLTVTRVRGHGGETEPEETYRGTTGRMELTEKVMLDIAVSSTRSSSRTRSRGTGYSSLPLWRRRSCMRCQWPSRSPHWWPRKVPTPDGVSQVVVGSPPPRCLASFMR